MSTTRTPRPTTAQDLWTCARHWDDLTDALTARTGTTWPPPAVPTATHDPTSDHAEAATWRAEALRALERRPDQPGWTAAPLRLGILDTIRTVEAGLLELADQIAGQVQRPLITPAPPRRAPRARSAAPAQLRPAPLVRFGTGERQPAEFDFPNRSTADRARRVQEADDTRRNLAALRDERDPRRWQLPASGQGAPRSDWGRRTAPRAALWLLARVQHAPGPVHRRLTPRELARVATVAQTCARMVEHALDTGDGQARLGKQCPDCGGRLTMYGGGGAVPVVRCGGCGHLW
ncbi:hypothetical protein [Streptomyces sp. NRRL F-5135]|uniref:hypothetical protein n=1 Tax=Streptomyces sp. NRRL F-5135 TaxID=1463858 RepID=UPI0004C7EEFB|nr:hypothetical protein [Streptomyces sp. NRRL F-5135]